MRALVFTAVIVAVAATNQNYFKLPSPYTTICNSQRNCVRTPIAEATGEHQQSQAACSLTCGQYGALFPEPTGTTQLSKDVVHFNPYNMQVTKIAASSPMVAEMLDEATRYFRRNVHFMHPDFPDSEKRPYTQDVQRTFEDFSQQSNQREFSFNQRQQYQQQPSFQRQQQQQQMPFFQRQSERNQNEFSSPFETQTYEEWERYSPFRTQEYDANTERQQVDIEITVTSPDSKLDIENTDESYNLIVQTQEETTTVTILATTYFGANHALETLSQLIAYDETNENLVLVSNANINDEPEYKYRGVSLDTGRNFFTREELMTLLDGMSQNKLNVLQWQLTDAASFPLYTNRVPQMAYYGAYSPRKVYYKEDVQAITEYAQRRGIKVIPVFTAPGHTFAGWNWAEKEGLGNLALCTPDQYKGEGPWFEYGKEAPTGQLNPTNEKVYDVLGEIYKDMVDYFDPDMFHMGGEDVSFKCWQNSPEIQQYLADNGRERTSREYFELWNNFQSNAYAKLREASPRPVKPIVYASSFARNYLNKDQYYIQLTGKMNATENAQYVEQGYTVIFSNTDQWRLDCDGTTWNGEKNKLCPAETPTWENFYNGSPLDVLYDLGISNARSDLPQRSGTTSTTQSEKSIRDRVLGGVVTFTSAEIDGRSFQSKAFPRVSAFAERLWSDPRTTPFENDVKLRLSHQRNRMVDRGIKADPVQPEFCLQYQDQCYSEDEYRLRSNLRQ